MDRPTIPAELMPTPEGAPDDEAIDADINDWGRELDLPVPPDAKGARGWIIEDDGAAEWAMRRLAAMAAEAEANERRAQEYAAQVQAWLESVNGPLSGRMRFFEQRLEDYARRYREADPKHHKTLKLVAGRVTSSARAARAVVTHADEFVAWARNVRPDLVRMKFEPAVAELRAAAVVKEETLHAYVDGEKVPGVAVEPGRVTFTVKPGG